MTREMKINVEIECELDEDYFLRWENLSPEIVAFWKRQTELPHCGQEGHLGLWCDGCYFKRKFEENES